MTLQEIYDKVAIHLLTQNARAVSSEIERTENCMYRTAKGLTCAVGCLIPDKIYRASFEGNSVCRFYLELAEALDLQDPKGLKLLECLQHTHDIVLVEHWSRDLRLVANDFKLNADVVNNFKRT